MEVVLINEVAFLNTLISLERSRERAYLLVCYKLTKEQRI